MSAVKLWTSVDIRDENEMSCLNREWVLASDHAAEVKRLKARVKELKRALKKARGIYGWMSGSPDFCPDGIAYEGWVKTVDDRNEINAALEGRFHRIKINSSPCFVIKGSDGI